MTSENETICDEISGQFALRMGRSAVCSAAGGDRLQSSRQADFHSESLAEVFHQIEPAFTAALQSFQQRVEAFWYRAALVGS